MRINRASRVLAGGLAGAALLASFALGSPTAGAHDVAPSSHRGHSASHGRPVDQAAIVQIRQATAKYHNVDVALADGYVPVGECAELPGVGAMGIHYLNPELAMDDVIDPTKPELLLYEPGEDGKVHLVGAEWFMADPDQDLATDEGRPTIFGTPFDGPMEGHEPGMPVHFDLHAWVWKANPAGTFAAWNPNVSCH
jgi:hypothetical protein